MKVGTVLSNEELLHVKRTMEQYNHTEGYIEYLEGKLTFFDSNPYFDGGGCYITLEQINQSLELDESA